VLEVRVEGGRRFITKRPAEKPRWRPEPAKDVIEDI
jgi:hypothetical protein